MKLYTPFSYQQYFIRSNIGNLFQLELIYSQSIFSDIYSDENVRESDGWETIYLGICGIRDFKWEKNGDRNWIFNLLITLREKLIENKIKHFPFPSKTNLLLLYPGKL